MNSKIPNSNNELGQRKRVKMSMVTLLTGRNTLFAIQNEALKERNTAYIQQTTPETPNN